MSRFVSSGFGGMMSPVRHRVLPVTVLCGALVSGCAGSSGARHYAKPIENNFLNSCVTNAERTAGSRAAGVDLYGVCRCLLARVERRYTEPQFVAFEQKLKAGSAPSADTAQLTADAKTCAARRSG
jgi:hypothetical protein